MGLVEESQEESSDSSDGIDSANKKVKGASKVKVDKIKEGTDVNIKVSEIDKYYQELQRREAQWKKYF